VRPLPGVRSLFAALRGRCWTPVLASSSKKDVELLDIGDLIEASTSKDDVTRSKPAPDILAEALERVRARERSGAWVVGDSPWDALAATRLGLPVVGFRSGGFPESDLRRAGARMLFDGPEDLLAHLERSPFDDRC
jgi:HAD superfamily hydrolase (TIGR01509 family)